MKKVLCAILALMLALLCACGEQPAKEVVLSDVMSQISAAYGLEEDMLELMDTDLMELYGIDSADVKQFAAKIRMESIQADEIVLIEAVDAKAAERVKGKLEGRLQSKLNETRDYLPDEFAKVEKCKVMQHGNYVSLIVCADAEKAVETYEKALK